MTAEDEARAAAYRAQEKRRGQNLKARALALSGSPAAEADLKARWAALRDWITTGRKEVGGRGTDT